MDTGHLAALKTIVEIVNDWERQGHALNCLAEIRAISRRELAPHPQIPRDQLVEGTWYVGRGHNANVALWGRIGKGDNSRLTFLTIGFRFHQPDVKDEGYYWPAAGGCFQPFQAIDEGSVVEAVGTAAWDQHYAKLLEV